MSPLWWGLYLLTFSCPWYPWILCRGPTWPRKKWNLFYFFHFFFILTQKVLVRLLLYLTCKLLLNRGYNVNQDGPSLIIQAQPKMFIFSHICKTYCPPPWFPLFFLVVHMYPVWWCLRDTSVTLDSTCASPRPPKMKTKIWKKFHQITSICCILLSFGVILRCLWGIEAYIYIYKMFMSSVDQCILI